MSTQLPTHWPHDNPPKLSIPLSHFDSPPPPSEVNVDLTQNFIFQDPIARHFYNIFTLPSVEDRTPAETIIEQWPSISLHDKALVTIDGDNTDITDTSMSEQLNTDMTKESVIKNTTTTSLSLQSTTLLFPPSTTTTTTPTQLEFLHNARVYHIDHDNIGEYDSHCREFWHQVLYPSVQSNITTLLPQLSQLSQELKKDQNDNQDQKDTTTTTKTTTTTITNPYPPFSPNPILFLQYTQLLSKRWCGVGVLHLFEFHINLSILFGANVTRYLIPSDSYDKGTYSLTLPELYHQRHQWLPSKQHLLDGKHYIRPNVDVVITPEGAVVSVTPTNHFSQDQHNQPNQPNQPTLKERYPYLHTICHFPPGLIMDMLSHLYKTNQLSPLLLHYLNYVISPPSFCNLLSSILSPHFDIIIPLTLPTTPTPGLFHTLFATLNLVFDDLLELAEPLYSLLLLGSSTLETLKSVNINPFIFTQPSPHIDGPLNLEKIGEMIEQKEAKIESQSTNPSLLNLRLNYSPLRPTSILINTMLGDASSNVMRVTDGLK